MTTRAPGRRRTRSAGGGATGSFVLFSRPTPELDDQLTGKVLTDDEKTGLADKYRAELQRARREAHHGCPIPGTRIGVCRTGLATMGLMTNDRGR